jgi:hypothetical protein
MKSCLKFYIFIFVILPILTKHIYGLLTFEQHHNFLIKNIAWNAYFLGCSTKQIKF